MQANRQRDTNKEESFRIFDKIHKRYDLLNRILSLGQDILWRRRLARWAKEEKKDERKGDGKDTGKDGKKDGEKDAENKKQLLLDLATGTGDVALCLLKHNNQITAAYGCDRSKNMLLTGREKSNKKKLSGKMIFLQGDGAQIPFADNTFDLVTIAFGIRNMADPLHVLKEMRRVLKGTGKILILEFSLPGNKAIKGLHLFYLRRIIPNVGALISKDLQAYRYLNVTIESFPYGDAFCDWMREAGFEEVRFKGLTFGVATLYEGKKTSGKLADEIGG